jgi:hypothetical protein
LAILHRESAFLVGGGERCGLEDMAKVLIY